jgi:hemoglobin
MNLIITKRIFVSLAAISILLSGTFLAQNALAQEGARLTGTETFKAFGGKAGLEKIMDTFWLNLLEDPRTKPFFTETEPANFKKQLVDQTCEIMNGGCEYKGGKMKPIHAGHLIKREHFNALVEQLQRAMETHGVPFAAQNKLLAALAPMHRDIVTKP